MLTVITLCFKNEVTKATYFTQGLFSPLKDVLWALVLFFTKKNGVSVKSCAIVWAIVVVRVATMYSPYYTASVWELQSRINPKSSHAPILTGKLK